MTLWISPQTSFTCFVRGFNRHLFCLQPIKTALASSCALKRSVNNSKISLSVSCSHEKIPFHPWLFPIRSLHWEKGIALLIGIMYMSQPPTAGAKRQYFWGESYDNGGISRWKGAHWNLIENRRKIVKTLNFSVNSAGKNQNVSIIQGEFPSPFAPVLQTPEMVVCKKTARPILRWNAARMTFDIDFCGKQWRVLQLFR